MRALNLQATYDVRLCTANASRQDVLDHIASWLDTQEKGALTINKSHDKVTLEYRLFSSFALKEDR